MTPLMSALEALIQKGNSRFHMPGHKGRFEGPFSGIYPYDITELEGLESLYDGIGAIAETEARYTRLYNTKASFLSAGGSTLCIQAMLTLACKPTSRLIMARNAHTAAVSAMAMLDLHPVWIKPTQAQNGLLQQPGADEIDSLLAANDDARVVYLTSPDYYGNMADIAAISAVCRRYGAVLLVDNAHGAHLNFLDGGLHPARLGADICCDSLHKTLPVFTGGALLHIQNEKFIAGAKRAMSLFGSTSPSFLILASADYALDYLENRARKELAVLCGSLCGLHEAARGSGLVVSSGIYDPARLTLCFAAAGYTREQFERLLEKHKITAEYLDDSFCVLLPSPQNTSEDFLRLRDVIEAEHPKMPVNNKRNLPPLPRVVCSIREAVFAPQELIGVENAEGRTAGRIQTACPPGVPVLMPGEKICKDCVRLFKSSGIYSVDVLR